MSSRKKVLLKVCYLISKTNALLYSNNLLKVIILGDSGVGKTSLMNQYVRNRHSSQLPTESEIV